MSLGKDLLGRDLEMGDTVAYATNSYKTAHQRVGKLVPLDLEAHVEARVAGLYVRVKGEGYPSVLKRPSQVVRVETLP